MKYLIVMVSIIFLITITSTMISDSKYTPPEKPIEVTKPKPEPIEKKEITTWIKPFKKTYKNRNEISIETTIVVWSWKGGDTIKLDQLKQTIIAVQERISIPSNEHTTSLLLETSAVESSRGIDMIQRGGPARGILQMEPTTEKYLKEWLKKYHPSVYKEVVHFYNDKKDKVWNSTYNVPYQIAMSLAYYWHKCGDKLPSLITTREDRARIWKQFYNTHKGKGTISKYHEKSEKYL